MMKKQYLTPATQEQGVLMNAQVLQTASPIGLGKGENVEGTGPGGIIHIN